MLIEADYQLEQNEIVQGIKTLTARASRMVEVWGCLFTLLCLTELIANDGRGSIQWFFNLVLALTTCALPSFLARRRARSEPILHMPIQAELTLESVCLITPHSRIPHQWTAFVKTAETNALFLLLTGPRAALLVPKRALSTAQAAQLRTFLKNLDTVPASPRRGGRHQ